MKTILRIARLELNTLFFSPVAWLVLVVFAYQLGSTYVGDIHSAIGLVKVKAPIEDGLTSIIIELFWVVQSNLYLYIPLLTMGLMSREISSGSIKLLLSSPVKISEIVLGKFLAMMIYGLMLVGILLLFVFTSGYLLVSADMGRLVSGVIGLYLLICAYSAIGLLMSCFTSYQVVAAISTLVVLAALNFVGTVGQNIDIVRGVTYYLSIAGRSGQFMAGLVTTKNVAYFLIVTVVLLCVSVMVLQAGRKRQPLWVWTARCLSLLAVAIGTGYITSRPFLTGYWDMTASKSQTVTPATRQILRQFMEPLEIHTYVNFLDTHYEFGLPEARNNDRDFFDSYQRFLSDEIRIGYTYYYDSTGNDLLRSANPKLNDKELAIMVAKSKRFDFDRLLAPPDIRKLIDLRPEGNHFVRQMESGGKTSFLRLYSDMPTVPFESEIAASLKRLVSVPPKIYFLTGHNERSITKGEGTDYKTGTSELTFRQALVNQGFDVAELSLATQDIPKDITALVIADPVVALDDDVVKKIQRYIAGGGNILIAGEPGRQALLNPLTEPLGVRFLEGTMVEVNKELAPDLIIARFSDCAGMYTGKFKSLAENKAVITMPGTTPLLYDGNGPYHMDPILVSDKDKSWNRTGTVNMDSGKVSFNTGLGDKRKSETLVLALTAKNNGKEQRVIISGDADFMSNAELFRGNVDAENLNFTAGLFKWLSCDAFPIDTDRPKMADRQLRISRKGLPLLKVLFLAIFPGLLLITGGLLLIYRMRK